MKVKKLEKRNAAKENDENIEIDETKNKKLKKKQKFGKINAEKEKKLTFHENKVGTIGIKKKMLEIFGKKDV